MTVKEEAATPKEGESAAQDSAAAADGESAPAASTGDQSAEKADGEKGEGEDPELPEGTVRGDDPNIRSVHRCKYFMYLMHFSKRLVCIIY